jgi:hypothetical protein
MLASFQQYDLYHHRTTLLSNKAHVYGRSSTLMAQDVLSKSSNMQGVLSRSTEKGMGALKYDI